MAIRSIIQEDGNTLLIVLSESFDVTCYSKFKEVFEPLTQAMAYEVDMSGIDFMDSSGLGLLIMLREHANRFDSSVKLKHPSPVARANLDRALFNELFDIVS
jgi:anti-anti-sigma factor